MGRLTIHGETPAEGTLVDCRIRVREVEHHRVRVDAELARPDGTSWMQIHDWEDWRFHWPARYRDVFRAPDEVFVGEELPLLGVPATEAVAVWLAPPGDMARPVWRDVLECTQLAPEEREICRSLRSSDARRTHWLWGRIAAKEAVRRLWQAAGKPARFPADLVIGAGPNGCPALIDRARPSDCDLPEVSIAHADGLSLALAARRTGIGVDVIALSSRTDNKEAERLSEGEQSLLKGVAESSVHEWRRRLVAARQAAAKAAGIAPGKAAGQAEVCSIAQQTGTMIVRIKSLDQGCEPHALIVRTEHRAEHVWAWTLGERTIL
jgi:phosphopantetheinyl transferase